MQIDHKSTSTSTSWGASVRLFRPLQISGVKGQTSPSSLPCTVHTSLRAHPRHPSSQRPQRLLKEWTVLARPPIIPFLLSGKLSYDMFIMVPVHLRHFRSLAEGRFKLVTRLC